MNLNKGQNIKICSSYWELFCRRGVIFCLVSILWTLVDFFWTKRLFSQGTLFSQVIYRRQEQFYFLRNPGVLVPDARNKFRTGALPRILNYQ